MAMAAVYTTINGMLVHESRGGVESFYFPDTLGSLTTVRSATGVKTYGAEYWPYGEIQTETGTNPSPWSFVGLLGYLRDTASRLYVRARHYRPGLARWQTVDPLWPRLSPYGYGRLRPVSETDPSGLIPANIIAGVIGGLLSCLISAGISWIGSHLKGEGPAEANCKAGTKCVAKGLGTGIGIASMNPALACALSIASEVISLLADALCPLADAKCPKLPSLCDLTKAAISGAGGCLGWFGAKDGVISQVGEMLGWIGRELAKYAGGILASSLGSIISGSGKIACDWAGPAFGKG